MTEQIMSTRMQSFCIDLVEELIRVFFTSVEQLNAEKMSAHEANMVMNSVILTFFSRIFAHSVLTTIDEGRREEYIDSICNQIKRVTINIIDNHEQCELKH